MFDFMFGSHTCARYALCLVCFMFSCTKGNLCIVCNICGWINYYCTFRLIGERSNPFLSCLYILLTTPGAGCIRGTQIGGDKLVCYFAYIIFNANLGAQFLSFVVMVILLTSWALTGSTPQPLFLLRWWLWSGRWRTTIQVVLYFNWAQKVK